MWAWKNCAVVLLCRGILMTQAFNCVGAWVCVDVCFLCTELILFDNLIYFVVFRLLISSISFVFMHTVFVIGFGW